jgi:DNA-binding response OmpR family regulator
LSDGTEASLTGTEFRLLRCLMSRPGQVFSKEQLMEQLYNLDDNPSDNVIEAYIRRLRKLVGADTIVTRRGQGYMFNDTP